MRIKASAALLVSLSVLMVSCDSSSDRDTSQGGGGGPVETTPVFVSSRILAPNGQTPVANATIFQLAEGAAPRNLVVGVDCPQPSRPSAAAVCSDGQGNFTIAGEAVDGVLTLLVEKGAFKQTFEVPITNPGTAENPTTVEPVSLAATPQAGAPRIAVVLGVYDNIEEVIEDVGITAFDRYDSSAGEGVLALANLFDPNASPTLTDYDIVFINCGADVLVDGTPAGNQRRDYLRSYVQGGGRIYVTDLSADYIENAFPEVIDYAGSGPGGEELTANVLVPVLGDYLDGRQCKDSDGDPVACRNQDGTINITGLLGGWRVIGAPGAGFQDKVTFYTRSEVTYFSSSTGSEVTETRPLNFSVPFGEGVILYSSFHTVESSEALGRPQERVLEYLVFE